MNNILFGIRDNISRLLAVHPIFSVILYAVMFFSLVLSGCYNKPPLYEVQQGMLDHSRLYQAHSLDDKVLIAVQQLVRTLRPEYRECNELYQQYREVPGYHVRRMVGHECKFTLGLVDVCDLYRRESTSLHKYITEKVLTYAFLQEVFVQHYRFVERIPINTDIIMGLGFGVSGSWNTASGANIGASGEALSGTVVFDSAAGTPAAPAPVPVPAPRVTTSVPQTILNSEKNRISAIREREQGKKRFVRGGGPVGAYPLYTGDNLEKVNTEIAEVRKKIAEWEKKPRTTVSTTELNKLNKQLVVLLRQQVSINSMISGEDENLFKVDPEYYDSQSIAKFLGQRYQLDVIITGFLINLGDHCELTLRMIETRHGQVIAVGFAKIDWDLIGSDLYYY